MAWMVETRVQARVEDCAIFVVLELELQLDGVVYARFDLLVHPGVGVSDKAAE